MIPTFAPDSSATLRLAVELFKNGDWSASRTECRRALDEEPADGPAALLCAMAALRLGLTPTNELEALCSSAALTGEAQAIARCELGDLLIRDGHLESAFAHFRLVFLAADSTPLLRRSARSLTLILDRYPQQARSSPELITQLDTCSELWRNAAPAQQNPSPQHESWTGLPVEWIVSFYRTQIGPAIGRRCSLAPSCSEYAMQALRKHGALGLAIYADRAVREPDVVRTRKDPVPIGDRMYYRDPLDEHDNWLTPE